MTNRVPYYKRSPFIADWQQLQAVRLWKEGNDTYEIARKLGVGEHLVYNELPKWRSACERGKAA